MNFKNTIETDFDLLRKNYLDTFNRYVDFIVWGYGNAYKTFMDTAGDLLKVRYVVDANPLKLGTTCDGHEVKLPSCLYMEDRQNTKFIILPTGDIADQIVAELLKMGFDESSYCFANDILIVFNYFYRNKIVIPMASICVTTKCTLRCHGCNEYIPYIENQFNVPIEAVKKDVDQLFKHVDFCGEIAFAAGENLLNQQLSPIIDYLHDNYRSRYFRMFCNTNGTVSIKQDLLKSLQRADCLVRISKYSSSSKLFELTRVLEDSGIEFIVNESFSFGDSKSGTWFDFGSPLISHKRSEEEKRFLYSNCQLYCRMIHNGIFYHCPTQFGATVGGLYSNNAETDLLVLYEADDTDILKFFLGFNEHGYINFCDRCDGMGSSVNPRTIPAGRQLSREEISIIRNAG